jgi:hypothetical protein
MAWQAEAIVFSCATALGANSAIAGAIVTPETFIKECMMMSPR